MKQIRTRFAPSPTGIMHIGNIRTALLNYIFAKQNNGVCILRIEDTDPKRNFDPGAKHIQKHLSWLGLQFDEGPQDGPCQPYFQSQRTEIYKNHLNFLQKNNSIYRCFCTQEELDAKRQRQIAMKKPPRYDGTCAKLSQDTIQKNLQSNTPFVWRMKVDANKQLSFNDLARGTLTFDLKNFSDFPITREDGSFTFMFANCVDDFEMNITHVLRGEDHLTNTVGQVVILQAFGKEVPIFWHLSILCNQEGKKLSKRDNGFSLEDLKATGFLPEAICNYLGIIGASFEQEILSLDELINAYNFENINTASQIKYDIEKLRWINHKWIAQSNTTYLAQQAKPFLAQVYDISTISDTSLQCLLKAIQTDMHTLQDSIQMLKFYFEKPVITKQQLLKVVREEKLEQLLTIISQPADEWNTYSDNIKKQAKIADISCKELFSCIRMLITGSAKGLQIHDLFDCLDKEEFFSRLNI